MKRRKFFLGLLLAAMAGIGGCTDKPDAKASLPVDTAVKGTNHQVIAYYFHGTIRCETCLKIERQTHEAIKRRFEKELAAKRLVFESVNYDKRENQHYSGEYRLPCPSLVIVRRKDGKDQKWKLLGETWQLIEDSGKFDKYVEDEVDKYLRDIK